MIILFLFRNGLLNFNHLIFYLSLSLLLFLFIILLFLMLYRGEWNKSFKFIQIRNIAWFLLIPSILLCFFSWPWTLFIVFLYLFIINICLKARFYFLRVCLHSDILFNLLRFSLIIFSNLFLQYLFILLAWLNLNY